MDEDESYLRQALQLAEEGMRRGDGGPFGALIVRDGRIVGRGWNQVLSSNDPTAHAEVVAIRAACLEVRSCWLPGSVLYSSCEPCPMCLAAAHWARIARLVYAADRLDAAAMGFADNELYRQLTGHPQAGTLPARQILQGEARLLMQRWLELPGHILY